VIDSAAELYVHAIAIEHEAAERYAELAALIERMLARTPDPNVNWEALQ
jgi:hypothetical protein